MNRLNYLPVLLLAFLMFSTGCQKDEIQEPDRLAQYNILGKWWLQDRTICGITDMIVHYDTIAFTTGIKSDDLLGEFKSSRPGGQTTGQFEIDPQNGVIHFDYNNKQSTYAFLISGNALTFTYTEDSCAFIEGWRKVE
jgi:hypothetical protein